jgi:hypothetical protein
MKFFDCFFGFASCSDNNPCTCLCQMFGSGLRAGLNWELLNVLAKQLV